MECKIMLTRSHCSCYVRKSQEEEYKLYYIEGEEFFDSFIIWFFSKFY